MSSGDFGGVKVRGRLQLGRVYVTAATIAAADGLLVLDESTSGAWVEVESGATIRGIMIVNASGDDVTAVWDGLITALTIVSSPAMPYAATFEHEAADAPAIDPSHRLWCPSVAVPGTFGDAAVTQHQITIAWDPSLSRWRVPWSAA